MTHGKNKKNFELLPAEGFTCLPAGRSPGLRSISLAQWNSLGCRMPIPAFYTSKQARNSSYCPLTLYFEPDKKISRLGTGERGSWGGIRSTIKRLLAILPVGRQAGPQSLTISYQSVYQSCVGSRGGKNERVVKDYCIKDAT
jgi:hypothetical protein